MQQPRQRKRRQRRRRTGHKAAGVNRGVMIDRATQAPFVEDLVDETETHARYWKVRAFSEQPDLTQHLFAKEICQVDGRITKRNYESSRWATDKKLDTWSTQKRELPEQPNAGGPLPLDKYGRPREWSNGVIKEHWTGVVKVADGIFEREAFRKGPVDAGDPFALEVTRATLNPLVAAAQSAPPGICYDYSNEHDRLSAPLEALGRSMPRDNRTFSLLAELRSLVGKLDNELGQYGHESFRSTSAIFNPALPGASFFAAREQRWAERAREAEINEQVARDNEASMEHISVTWGQGR